MKKGLFLLPLMAGFIMAGCEFSIAGTTISFGDKKEEQQNTSKKDDNSGSNTNNNNNNNQNDQGNTDLGTPLATITMSKNTDMTSDAEAETAVFENNGYSVEVSIGQNTSNTVAAAVAATGNYEFRIYAKMDLTFKGDSFSKLLIKYSSYTNGTKTYYFDYDELDGATNEYDNDKCEAVVTLDSATSEWTVNCWHQTRIASVAFYA